MNYLYNLFPIKSLIFFDSNTLTAYWVLGTLIFFGIFIYRHILKRLKPIFISLQELNGNFSYDNISSNIYLSTDWIAYSHTFISNEGERQKTEEEARSYFNENNIVTNNLSNKILQTVPGTLVGFGILGTFVGLTFGISGFDTTSTNSIQKSIQTLLSGMGTAFVSSIWGMALSIIFVYIEKWWIRKIAFESNTLSNILDNKFKLTKADEIRFKKEDEEKLYRDMLCFSDNNNNIIRPAEFFRRFSYETEQQTKALKSFSTDLADGIKISNETIMALGDRVGKLFESTLTTHLSPVFQNLDHAVDELIKAKEQSSEEVINKIVGKLEESISKIGANFQDSLSGSAMAQLNQLVLSLGTLENSLSTIPQYMQEMMENVRKSIEIQQETIKQTSSMANEETAAAISIMKEQIEDSSNKFKSIITDLQTNMSNIFVNQKKTTDSSEALLISSYDVVAQSKDLIDKMTQSVRAFENNFNNLNTLAGQISLTSDLLKNTGERVKATIEQHQTQTLIIQNNNKEILKQLETSMVTAKNVAIDYSQKFKIINEGLQGIFKEIDNGLAKYQETVHTSLNIYLRDFTSEFSEAAKSLSGSIEMFNEFNDGVEGLVNKINDILVRSHR